MGSFNFKQVKLFSQMFLKAALINIFYDELIALVLRPAVSLFWFTRCFHQPNFQLQQAAVFSEKALINSLHATCRPTKLVTSWC